MGLHGGKTIKRFAASGLASLAPRTRGRRSGEDRALLAEQEQAIARTVCDRRPEQLKMDFALWSRAAVMLQAAAEHMTVLANQP